MADCQRCGHTRKEHCTRGTQHVEWKSIRAQNGGDQRVTVCITDHCNVPLCSCVDFIGEEVHVLREAA